MKLSRSRLLIGAAVVALLIVGMISGCGGRQEVPDVVGKSQADAVRALQDAGFALGEVSNGFSSQVPVGAIMASDPAAGAKGSKGDKVALVINSGIEGSVKVPMVTGVPQATAESQLNEIDLVPVVAQAYDSTVTAGVVIAQVPAAGSTVAPKSQIVLQVSKGPAPQKVAVPNVKGKAQADAVSAIQKAGLKAKVYSVYSDAVAKGKVIGQSPAAGAKVVVGSEVGIAVSLGKGVGAVTVPNVVGKKEADAVNAMKSAGLAATVYRQYSDSVAAGLVIAQLPDAGATAAKGAQVAIAVSLGKATGSGNVAVPSVVGQTQEAATTALETAGFTVQVVPQASDAVAGTVTAQLPVSGSEAPPASVVVILVSSGQPK